MNKRKQNGFSLFSAGIWSKVSQNVPLARCSELSLKQLYISISAYFNLNESHVSRTDKATCSHSQDVKYWYAYLQHVQTDVPKALMLWDTTTCL